MSKLNPANVRKALEENFGLKAAAARSLGVTRQALHQFLNRHPEICQETLVYREAALDIAERALIQAVEAGDIRAIRYMLDRLGKSRGYLPPALAPKPLSEQPKEPAVYWIDPNGNRIVFGFGVEPNTGAGS